MISSGPLKNTLIVTNSSVAPKLSPPKKNDKYLSTAYERKAPNEYINARRILF